MDPGSSSLDPWNGLLGASISVSLGALSHTNNVMWGGGLLSGGSAQPPKGLEAEVSLVDDQSVGDQAPIKTLDSKAWVSTP